MKTLFKMEPFAFFVIFCLLSISLTAEAQYFRGYLQTPQGSADCNPCVENVFRSVIEFCINNRKATSSRADPML